jgi:hypothetical protein
MHDPPRLNLGLVGIDAYMVHEYMYRVSHHDIAQTKLSSPDFIPL